MKTRCLNPKNPAFKDYGGRGISVCERWMVFENFLADMGERPSAELSLDRRENDGNYEPGNCRWATKKEQKNNARDQRLRKNSKTGLKGVSFNSREKKYHAAIRHDHRDIFLGSFDDPQTAASAYDAAAVRFRGEKAVTNGPNCHGNI